MEVFKTSFQKFLTIPYAYNQDLRSTVFDKYINSVTLFNPKYFCFAS